VSESAFEDELRRFESGRETTHTMVDHPTPPGPGRSQAAGPMGPVEHGRRIDTIDVLRGFAIFGILMVNVAFFAMPSSQAMQTVAAADGADERLATTIVQTLFTLKFVSLFSLLFGVGMVIQHRRAMARGTHFHGFYLRRIAVLMAMGLVHGVLIWPGDILFIYAWVALAALLVLPLRPAILLALASGTLLLSVALWSFFAWQTTASMDMIEDTGTSRVEIVEAYEQRLEDLRAEEPGTDDRWRRYRAAVADGSMWEDPLAQEILLAKGEHIAYGEGPWLLTTVQRGVSFFFIFVFAFLSGFGFRIIAMFMLGMALMKLDFFEPDRRRWHRLLAFVIGPAGLALEVAATAMELRLGMDRLVLSQFLHFVGSFGLCLGFVGGWTLLVRAGALAALTRGLANVGRMALTNYLGQSVVATLVFYWYGLGLYGQVRWPVLLVGVVAFFIVQIIASTYWLRSFRMGPVEWFWRSLTYWRLQPVRRASTAESPS